MSELDDASSTPDQLAPASHLPRGNSNDSVRQHNLSVVMRLVHHSRGLSRSAITRATHLNRSTIAALVGELVDQQLVVEREAASANQVGRPSPIVEPHAGPVAIAINPEIDAITVGLVGLGGVVHKRIRHETAAPPTVTEMVSISSAVIDRLRAELSASHRVIGIGVAVPGLVRAADGVVRLAPHLGWTDEPVGDLLSRATGFAVDVANDANLAIAAERVFGAARGVSDIVYLNGGASGIGGGIITGGASVRGSAGYAGEFGHTLVNSGGATDAVGVRGSLETEVSQSALLRALALASADPDTLEDALLASDDDAVKREVRRQLEFLSVALCNAVNLLNPKLLLLGGFLASLHAAAPGYLEAQVTAHSLSASVEGLTIGRAQLGSNLLMIGAAELVFAGLLARPNGHRSSS